MKLSFLKIEKMLYSDNERVIVIPAGGLVFKNKGRYNTISQQLQLSVNESGRFIGVTNYVDMNIYEDKSLIPVGNRKESVISMLANQDFYNKLIEYIENKGMKT